jgi:hypothetical protein
VSPGHLKSYRGDVRPSRRVLFTVVAATLMACALVATVPQARGDVAFVEEGDLVLEPGKAESIEVFNGSKAAITIRFAVTGDARRAVSVHPARRKLAAGQIGAITLRTTEALTGQLVAYGTDGTLARLKILSAATKAALPANLELTGTTRVPTPLGGTATNVEQTIGGFATDGPRVLVGYVSSDEGDVATVYRDGNTISVSDVNGAGEYKGTIKLSPDDTDGTPLTLRVRDSFGWAVLVLVLGLLIAAVSEYWLSWLRPRRELATRVERLKQRCLDLCKKATAEALSHREEAGSAVQRLYVDETADSLLKREGDRLTEGLKNALSDAERERWGPSGDELKTLETHELTYAELLRQSVAVATPFGDLERSLTGDERIALGQGALTAQVNGTLTNQIIRTPAELTECKSSATDLRAAVQAFVPLFRRYQQLQRFAHEKKQTRLEERALRERRELVRSFEAKGDADDWSAKADDLDEEIRKGSHARSDQPKLLEVALEEEAEEDAVVAAARARAVTEAMTAPGDALPAMGVVPRRARFLERNLSLADLLFAFFSWPLVVGAGLAVLYFGDRTFGSPGDYLAAFVWGSTAEIALSLTRRLIPTSLGGIGLS